MANETWRLVRRLGFELNFRRISRQVVVENELGLGQPGLLLWHLRGLYLAPAQGGCPVRLEG